MAARRLSNFSLDCLLDFRLRKGMKTSDIIKAIETHACDFGMKATSIGQMAVGNRHVYSRLTSGNDIQIRTAERLLDWIEQDRIRKAERAKTAASSPRAQSGNGT